MLLYRTIQGAIVAHDGQYTVLLDDWDTLLNRDDLAAFLPTAAARGKRLGPDFSLDSGLLPPIGSQEIWAAGVTYFRSRTARMEESQAAGGSSFYDRVYQADRPELFFKATADRTRGHRQPLRLRRDSKWIVPEPELTLVVTRSGKIIGYTVGNDLSCRDIEGENPLYLPQAKTFDGCAGIGPGIYVTDQPLPAETEIKLEIRRGAAAVFSGATKISQMKKSPAHLVGYLFRETSFPHGVLLMTGTGVVPPDNFTLQIGDEVQIAIDGIGTLVNPIE